MIVHRITKKNVHKTHFVFFSCAVKIYFTAGENTSSNKKVNLIEMVDIK